MGSDNLPKKKKVKNKKVVVNKPNYSPPEILRGLIIPIICAAFVEVIHPYLKLDIGILWYTFLIAFLCIVTYFFFNYFYFTHKISKLSTIIPLGLLSILSPIFLYTIIKNHSVLLLDGSIAIVGTFTKEAIINSYYPDKLKLIDSFAGDINQIWNDNEFYENLILYSVIIMAIIFTCTFSFIINNKRYK